ncbi:ESPR-type extended signal peptide-containing protein, partial [uncultured Dialister sp.]|uniref:ESPR-type extended signal peptide-containing protein n=1 Tax=uncultured Dialister sp. TaxID=278064 RepID=UPI002582E700
MNKIYKVIWSKAKHTYVVASEIAKGHTKGETTGRGLKRLAAALLVAAALLSPSFAWAEGTVTVELAGTGSTATVEVYTTGGTDTQVNAAKTYTYRKVAAEEHAREAADTEIKQAMTDQKTSTALHVSKDGNLIVGTKENQIVKNMKINGQLTSGSISTGDIASGGDVTVTGKMAADGVTDETTKDGTYIKQNNTVGNNLVSLDTQAKANADAINEEARKRKYSVTNLEKADAAEAATREAKDNELNERITNEANAIHDEIKAGDKVLDDRITNVKEYLETQTVSKTDAAVRDGAIVKAAKTIGENVTNLDAALAKETAARLGADAAQDKVIQQVNDNLVQSVTTINKNVADGFTALNQADANEAAAREAKDNELNERITNEANAIHDEIKAGDKVLDDRITNVKEYLEKQTKETAARIGADKAQDKVIEQVNQNMVDGFNTINKNMSDGFTALSQADANELAGRMAADTKLVEATNGGLSLDNDNVLQKTKTKISSTGEVTTSKEAATTLILNKGAANQVKIDSEGVTVGTSSTQMDAEGFTAGGHDYDAAGAALMSDGRIKGANGDFTVDTDGNVASGNVTSTGTVKGKTLTDGAGASMSGGTVTGTTLTDGKATISNGNIKTNGGFIQTGGGNVNTQGGEVRTNGGKVATSGGEINTGSGAIKTVGGDILTAGGKLNTSGGNIVAGTGDISGHNITASGVLSGDSLTVANGMTGRSLTLTGGDLDAGAGTIKTTGEVDAGTLNVRGKATVKDLEVKGEFKAETLTSKLDENNYTTINGGNVTSVNSKVSVDDARTYTSTSNLTEKGRTDTAADGTTTNVSVMTAGGSDSTISSLADKNQKSYITQNLKKILQGIQNGDNATTVDQAETGIKSTATDGKNTASTNLSNKGFNTYATDGTNRTYTLQTAESLTSQIGDDGKVKSVMKADGITNNADGGTITNSAKDLVNKATGDMTNTVGGKLLNDVTGDMENKVGGNLTTTVSGT